MLRPIVRFKILRKGQSNLIRLLNLRDALISYKRPKAINFKQAGRLHPRKVTFIALSILRTSLLLYLFSIASFSYFSSYTYFCTRSESVYIFLSFFKFSFLNIQKNFITF